MHSDILVAMGIRYVALSIDTNDYEHLRVGICPTCGEEPRLRDLDEDRASLDLDKSWSYLQAILRSDPPRPAAALVSGDVTNTRRGWRSYRGLLDPAEVRAVATDLAAVTTEEVQRYFLDRRRGQGPDDRSRQDFEYVSDYLAAAKTFTEDVVAQGHGIAYYIG